MPNRHDLIALFNLLFLKQSEKRRNYLATDLDQTLQPCLSDHPNLHWLDWLPNQSESIGTLGSHRLKALFSCLVRVFAMIYIIFSF